jgi:hypothetical protein
MISKIEKDEQEWALYGPKPQRSRAGGLPCFTGQKAEAACWGWPSPRPNVARLAQAGAARLARVSGGHRAQSRCGGVTPASELVAEV